MKNLLKTAQLFISYYERGQEYHYPVLPVPKKSKRNIMVGGRNFTITVPGSFKKGIHITTQRGGNFVLKHHDPLAISDGEGKFIFRIIYDWVGPGELFFKNFLAHSLVLHIIVAVGFAIHATITGPMIDNPINKEPTAERVRELLSKIKDEKPLRVKKPKPEKIEEPKIVEKVVIKKKVKKKKSFFPTKKRLAKAKKRQRPKRRRQTRTASRVRPKGRGGKVGSGGKVSSKSIENSLSFLSKKPGKKGAAAVTAPRGNRKQQFAAAYAKGGLKLGGGGSKKGAKYLKESGTYAGPIKTKGIRNVQSTVYGDGKGFKNGKGKGLNNVRGKVSNRALRGSNRGRVGGALSRSGGMRLSGKGSISEALIQRAINRRIERLTYCYEKALLKDSSLAGNIKMQWTIKRNGRVSRVKVIRSELNNRRLHRCLSREIKKIPFPRPKGGTATVQYPFKFKASSI